VTLSALQLYEQGNLDGAVSTLETSLLSDAASLEAYLALHPEIAPEPFLPLLREAREYEAQMWPGAP